MVPERPLSVHGFPLAPGPGPCSLGATPWEPAGELTITFVMGCAPDGRRRSRTQRDEARYHLAMRARIGFTKGVAGCPRLAGAGGHRVHGLPDRAGQTYNGDGTYYAADGSGNCSYPAGGDLMVRP